MIEHKDLGTVSAPVTLTALYAGNTLTVLSRLYCDLHLDITYTPKTGETDRIAYILIEYSNDNGETYYPKTVALSLPDSVELNNLSVDTAVTGIPLVMPNAGSSTGGVAYKMTYDMENIKADFIKISAKESGSADFGTLYINTTLTQNQK